MLTGIPFGAAVLLGMAGTGGCILVAIGIVLLWDYFRPPPGRE